MRRFISLVAAAVLFTAAAVWAAPDFDSMKVERYEPPKPAPAFELPDLQGKTQRLEDLKGKVVLLFFWATW